MPEMPSIPILSSPRFPASASPAPAASSGSSGATDVASTGASSSAAEAPGNNASLPGGEGNGSFASILKRQLAQAASGNVQPKIQPLALVAETTMLSADILAQLPLDATVTDDPSLSLAKITLVPELNVAPALDSSLLPELSADAVAAEAALADAMRVVQSLKNSAAPKLAADALSVSASLPSADQLAQKDDDVTQLDAPTANLAAILASFLPPAPVIAPKAAATPAEGGQPSADAADPSLLMASTTTLIQTTLGKEGEDSSANLAETPLSPATKAADFAAPLAVSADTVPVHDNRGEAPGVDVSFQNMLAAAQVSGQQRMVEAHEATSHTAPIEVKTPVGTRGWDGEVGDKLVWMVGRQEQRAELVLNPPQLGRIEVSLTMNGDQTNASFVSANPAVRDALEAALPRLREILADAGVSLGQTQVGAESSNNNASNQSANNRENGDNSSRYSDRNNQASASNILRQTGGNQWVKQGRGLVDTFA